MATVAVSLENRNDVVEDGVSVLYFTAAWCGPCRQFGPVVDQISEEFPEITFGKVDIDAHKELAEAYGIRSIPTLVAHRDGVPISKQKGAMGAPQLRALVTELKG